MVYRKPVHPRVDRWERRQTLAARVIGAGLALLLVAAGVILADRTAPSQPLAGRSTRARGVWGHGKIGRVGADCRAALAAGGVSWQESPDRPLQGICQIQDAVVITGGAARLEPLGAVMTCKEALAFAVWERQVVQPLALRILGAKVVSIQHYGAFSCRRSATPRLEEAMAMGIPRPRSSSRRAVIPSKPLIKNSCSACLKLR